MKKTVWLGCALLLGACGSNTVAPDPAADGGPTNLHGHPPAPPAPIDCATDPVSRFSGTVTALSNRAPIAGARVCVLEHDEIPCATTDATGSYQLGCAPRGDAAISFEASGFARGVWMWAGPSGDAYEDLDVSLARDAENSAYFAPTGVAYPDGASSLVTLVSRGTVGGLTAALRSGSGEGPFYSAGEGSRIDLEATSVASDHELAFLVVRPWEGWQEVEVELVPGPGATGCAQLGGAWAARDGAANVVRLPVRPDTESVIWVHCE